MYYPHHKVYSRRPGGLRATPEQVLQAAELWGLGKPLGFIAEKLGFSARTVSRWLYNGDFRRLQQPRPGVLEVDV